jgi:hypothetical protein
MNADKKKRVMLAGGPASMLVGDKTQGTSSRPARRPSVFIRGPRQRASAFIRVSGHGIGEAGTLREK